MHVKYECPIINGLEWYRQKDKYDRQADRQTDGQTDRQTDRQATDRKAIPI